MNEIRYIAERCTGCGKCYHACWLDVIRWDEKKERPIFAYPEDCVECNFCEISCEEQIITIVPDFDKPWPDVYHSSLLHGGSK